MSIDRLNTVQLGKYAEGLIKLELIRLGIEVYTAEVDDRGIDFVIGHNNRYYAVQVKSSKNFNYIYFTKDKFQPRENLLAALVLFDANHSPQFYIIPSMCWASADSFFVSRDYINKKSKPEYGLNLSRKNLDRLVPYALDSRFTNMTQLPMHQLNYVETNIT